ncbi:MAG TPA: tetratricopeptide repeat protein [Gemmatimonadaceae bacterium]|nr:tetratricopeptide repeat protein [Gemmatimonadaceae bacterium]
MRRAPRLAALLMLCASGAWSCARAQDDAGALHHAQAAYQTGQYDAAIKEFTSLSRRPNASVASRRGLLRALLEVGRLDEAERAARTLVTAPDGVQLQGSLGRILLVRGQLDAAQRAFTAAVRGGASDSLTASVELGVIHWMRGQRSAARPIFEHFIDVYNARHAQLTAAELTAVGIACRYLGAEQPELFKDAIKAFDEAIARDSTALEPRLQEADLFLAKHNDADAQTAIAAVLSRNPSQPRALLALAHRLANDGQPGVMATLRQALAVNPRLTSAQTFLAQLLLDTEDYPGAIGAAAKALAVDSASSDALAMVAAAHWLQGDSAGFDSARQRALARNPHDGEFSAIMGRVMARNRLYAQATDFARQGVARDSTSWDAYGVLGLNLLRTGRIGEGRRDLSRAFAGDPYDVQIKNTLDLLDTFSQYTEVRVPHFVFMIEKKDADVIALYLRDLARAAYDSLAARYGYQLTDAVRVEMYRSHADFSVRTMGLPGIGALGVSFGNVLAMDSPFGRPVGDFNWGSTFWHELAHAFTLGLSDHRVPRWFSEGLSVFEERRARPGWGERVTPDFLAALKGGALEPVSRLNDGFTRPRYPQQVIHSYYEASLVCELIARDHGTQALVSMLRAYRDGLTAPQVFARVLHTTPDAFDKTFATYLQQRFGERLGIVDALRLRGDSTDAITAERAGDGPFADRMRRAVAAFTAGRRDEAFTLFQQARAMFPEYTAGKSAYWYLSQLDEQRGDTAAAIAALKTIVRTNDTQYDAHLELAALLQKTGDTASAAQALEGAMYISPGSADVHKQLAGLYATLGNWPGAVRERRAVLALAPVDRAEALYQLALAQFHGGDVAGARRSVFLSLEQAPNFDRAQALLLQLQHGGPPPAGRVP